MSALAFFLSASSMNSHCQPCELEPVGACSARSRHSFSTSRLTGLSKSRRLRTERVVVRTSSKDRLRVMGGDYRSTHVGLADAITTFTSVALVPQGRDMCLCPRTTSAGSRWLSLRGGQN